MFKQIFKYNHLIQLQKRSYHPLREVMRKNNPAFYSDPNEIGEDIIRIVCLHDNIKDTKKVTMGATFEEMGFDSLDFVDIISEIELNYQYDFGAADWEQFNTINDIAQFMARDYYAQKH